jgi:hypothetical protein
MAAGSALVVVLLLLGLALPGSAQPGDTEVPNSSADIREPL